MVLVCMVCFCGSVSSNRHRTFQAQSVNNTAQLVVSDLSAVHSRSQPARDESSADSCKVTGRAPHVAGHRHCPVLPGRPARSGEPDSHSENLGRLHRHDRYVFGDRLVGLVVKASASKAKGPGFKSRLRRDFFGVESYQ